MTKFLKIEGENIWINISRIDAMMVRPQLRHAGNSEIDLLEERHEMTGAYEVTVFFQEKIAPVCSFASQAEAEKFVRQLLGDMLADPATPSL